MCVYSFKYFAYMTNPYTTSLVVMLGHYLNARYVVIELIELTHYTNTFNRKYSDTDKCDCECLFDLKQVLIMLNK